MLEDLKILFTFLIMSLMAAVIRFKTFTQAVLDTILGFFMGYTIFLALDFTQLTGASKCGFACASILWSRSLYDAISIFITKYLHKLIDKVVGIKYDR